MAADNSGTCGSLDAGQRSRPTLSVCIVTYEREPFLQRCLRSVAALGEPVDEVVVVDASAQDRTGSIADLAEGLAPPCYYKWAPQLAGWMTRSRNEALRWVTGEIVAFLDDDVVVSEDWSKALREVYLDPTVAASGGRTRNLIPGEEESDEPVGRYLPGGRLTSGFATMPTQPLEIDHGIGANMAFRRSVLAELGGFRDDYPGTALREDTDAFLRVKAIGGRVLFVPGAVVDHLPAPHVTGARFDTRYKLYGRRNHVVLLARHAGLGSSDLRRWVLGELRAIRSAQGVKATVLKAGVTAIGVAWGLAAAVRQASWHPSDPRRTDALGEELRDLLRRAPVGGPASGADHG